jgi:hypothetical protein
MRRKHSASGAVALYGSDHVAGGREAVAAILLFVGAHLTGICVGLLLAAALLVGVFTAAGAD